MDCTSIVNEYLSFWNTYSTKYSLVAVFMEVGKFYELYGTETEGNALEVGAVLNVQVSRKYKKISEISKSNPLFWGFASDNEASINKYQKILLDANYTIVYIKQSGDLPNGKKSRSLYKIISNGTNIEMEKVNSNISCIYSESSEFGMAVIDITTGKSTVFEGNLIDLHAFYLEKSPVETVVYSSETNFDFLGDNTHYYNNPITKISFLNEILSKVFPQTFLTPIEYLNLERYPISTIAYTMLIKFVWEHDSSVLTKLTPPEIYNSETTLQLLNSIEQLNLKGTFKGSLFNIISNTQTIPGKRLLLDRLLCPITSITELNKRYSLIEKGMQGILPNLDGILDLERLHRKLVSGKIVPYDFCLLDSSYTIILGLLDNEIYPFESKLEILKFKSFIADYQSIFDLEEIANGSDFIFKVSCGAASLDTLMNSIKTIEEFFISTEKKFNESKGEFSFKTDKNDSHFLVTTKLRWETFKKKVSKETLDLLRVTVTGNVVKVTSNEIKENSDKLIVLKETLKKETTKLFNEKVIEYSTYTETLNKITQFVAELDCVVSNIITAKKLKYTKPIISGTKSFLKAKGLRHPIVEVIKTDTEYIPNDVNIGKGTQTNGILLYGANSCGKSTLLKSVGLGVIMAQAGMYVPAELFEFYPFTKIITRIGNLDNIFKGQSTFIVEMTELNVILNRSDQGTLVLGDELCTGTETISAQAIVASTIETLCKKKTNFIFSTHIHSLIKILPPLKNLKTMHLTVTFTGGKLVYNRKLQSGNGPETYGLEVAKACVTFPEFHKRAYEIRCTLLGISFKESRYNTEVLLTKCEICDSTTDLNTHHIKFQSTFKKGDPSKNRKSNLVCLCESCHTALHRNEIVIHGWKDTLNGPELDWEEN